MIKISREEIIRIAQISRLKIYEHEINDLIEQVEHVVSYAQRVTQSIYQDYLSTRQMNVFRDDIVKATDPVTIVAQAPEKEGGFFVVPRILESNEQNN